MPGDRSSATLPAPAQRVWTVEDSSDLYKINSWGNGFFRVNPTGNVSVHPFRDDRCADLKELVDSLQARQIALPVLVRFTDILRQRLKDLYEAFAAARTELGYEGQYVCIYPIKVNQQSHVAEEYVETAKQYNFGIEAGSKPELLAVLAMTDEDEMPIVCNGFKDDEYIETVILAKKIGKNIIPVVEKFSELELIVKYAKIHEVSPVIGVRAKLDTRGSGKWEDSAGVRSKFGLTIPEVLRAFDYLKDRGMEQCLQLLHFHLGSQITDIRSIKGAITEAARIYAELYKAGAGMRYIDVGGGLGVDYDGSQTDSDSSMNYRLQEYANDVTFRIKSVCDDTGVPHPTILSESGRSLMAYHSVLVFNVLGVSSFDDFEAPTVIDPEASMNLKELSEIHASISLKNYAELYHDAQQARDEAVHSFNLGFISLRERSQAEALFWQICNKVRKIVAGLDYVPQELAGIDNEMRDTYFCNFSVFQSMPDSWAIRQLFPVIPIHRHEEEPTRRAVLADITCDSDGKVDKFIDLRDVKQTLELHPFDGRPYYLGAFLVGAYQEILGDLHNLFGDTNAVHVSIDEDGEVVLDSVVEGDTVSEVLSYVQYDVPMLQRKMRRMVERALREKRITLEESARFSTFYQHGMSGYTYLEEPPSQVNGTETKSNGKH